MEFYVCCFLFILYKYSSLNFDTLYEASLLIESWNEHFVIQQQYDELCFFTKQFNYLII